MAATQVPPVAMTGSTRIARELAEELEFGEGEGEGEEEGMW